MGIRVHKFLGYGLTGLEHDGMKLTDERVNRESWLLAHDGVPALGDYFAWLEARRAASSKEFSFSLDWVHLKNLGKENWPKPRDLDDCAAYDPEYGRPDVLVVRPYSARDWYRFDDPIDYVQETYLRDPGTAQESRADLIGACLYPYQSYMDDRTGTALDDKVFMWVRASNARDSSPEVLDTFAQWAGFSGHAEASGHVVPFVPEEVQDLVEYAQLFTHAGVWRQLRPVLYTYWA